MTQREPTRPSPLTGAIRDLLVNLIEEVRPGRLSLPPDEGGVLRHHLERVLIDTTLRRGHSELLRDLSRRRGEGPAETVYRHHELLPEERAEQVVGGGLEVLNAGELARLAVNPFALWDLADLIDEVLPDRWLSLLEARGRELMDELGVRAVSLQSPVLQERRPALARARVRVRGGWQLTESEVARAFEDQVGVRPAFRTALNLGASPARAGQVAEESVARAHEKVLEQGREFDSAAHYRNYLTKVAVRVVLDTFARNRRSLQGDAMEETAAPAAESEREREEAVRWCLEQLSAEDRELIQGYHLQERTYKELAEDRDVSTASAFRQVREARRRLRLLLEAQGFGL